MTKNLDEDHGYTAMELNAVQKHEMRSRQRYVGRVMVGLALLAILVIAAACGNTTQSPQVPLAASNDEPIAVEALPSGLGRGFPVVDLDTTDDTTTGLRAGELAPDFRLELEDGRFLNLRSLQGRPVMINFWATWCGPCRLEMPDIVEAAAAGEDLVVLAVNVQEDLDKVQPFVNDFEMAMPVALDSDGEMRKLFEVRGMPTSIFIDREGRISSRWDGLLTADLLNDLLAEIL